MPPCVAAKVLISHSEITDLVSRVWSRTALHVFTHEISAYVWNENSSRVEIPSHLMEYFAWDYRVVKEYAKHVDTREPIPQDMMNQMIDSDMYFAGLDTQLQLIFAGMDQRLFGPRAGVTVRLPNSLSLSWPSILASLMSRAHFFTQVRPGQLRGRYYSYLYARVIAARVEKVFSSRSSI